jgi:hypothetical protein
MQPWSTPKQLPRKMESQIVQIATHLGERDTGKLLSQPVPNSNAYAIGNSAHGHEQVQAIVTLRLGRQVDNKVVQEEEDSVMPQGKENGRDTGGES